MEKPSSILQAAISSLIGLIALNCVMLGALFAQVPPNPRITIGWSECVPEYAFCV
jgi:hypothetical protein